MRWRPFGDSPTTIGRNRPDPMAGADVTAFLVGRPAGTLGCGSESRPGAVGGVDSLDGDIGQGI
jgi:hypothetical protein